MMNNIEPFPPPKERECYLICDYIEMLCLINVDGEVDAKTIISRIYTEKRDRDIITEDDSDFFELNNTDYGDPNELTGEDFKSPERDDSYELKAKEWFNNLSARAYLYNDYYPFYIEDGDILKRKEHLSESANIYIYLLCCSNLRLFKRIKFGLNKLTSEFELLSKKVLQEYLPSFQVKLFGKSSVSDRFFPNKLYDAIVKLASLINEQCIANEEDFSDKNTGDGGLDLIGFRPLEDDTASGSAVFFGQCACSVSEWEKKKLQSHSENWRRRIAFTHPPANMLFIPFCFRKCGGNWVSSEKTSGCILIDRYRLCKLSPIKTAFTKNINDAIAEVMSTYEDY